MVCKGEIVDKRSFFPLLPKQVLYQAEPRADVVEKSRIFKYLIYKYGLRKQFIAALSLPRLCRFSLRWYILIRGKFGEIGI